MRRSPSDRRNRVADAAIDVLGEEGARGLTHRRVDREAGLPAGATSNVFRSREELMLGALDRLIEREIGPALDVGSARGSAADAGLALLTRLIQDWAAPENRTRLQARFELLAEGSRRPAFAVRLLERRSQIIDSVEALMVAEGRSEARTRAVSIVAWVDGILLHHLLDPTLIADEHRLSTLISAELGSP